MVRKTKRDWLIEALTVLAEVGAQSLTIDLLTERLSVTKGSFYHHFGNYDGFKESLLDFFEAEGTLEIIDYTEEGHTPQDKLQRLLEVTAAFSPDVEVAIRAWALQDDMVRAYQTRIDQRRIAYVKSLFVALTGDDTLAQQRAEILYIVYIGSQQVFPPINGEALMRHYTDLRHFFDDKNQVEEDHS